MAILKNTAITDGTQITPPIRTTWGRPTIIPTVVRITATGSWTCPEGVNYADILIVGGGGGGGYGHGAGGGGGTVLYKENHPVTPSTVYSITIGAGGAANTSDATNNAGGSTTAFGVTATGGGAGANESTAVGSGAGNGGGGTYSFSAGASGTLPTASGWTVFGGNVGGNGGIGNLNYPTGGGAGAGERGGHGGSGGSNQFGGGGGNGIMIDITGEPLFWGGGGGGVIYDTGGVAGAGGLGGGGGAAAAVGAAGNGGYFALNPGDHGQTGVNSGAQVGGSGGANTGGGGGGGANENQLGGAGGSGIVVIRYSRTIANEDPRGLVAYNKELRDIEVYDSTKFKWVTGNPYKNFAGHNMVRWSERAENWSKFNVSVTVDSTDAPNGTTTADKLVENTSAGASHYILQGFTVPTNSLWCGSVYVKAAGRSRVRLAYSNYVSWEGGGGTETTFNLNTQEIAPVGSAPVGYGIQDVGNGWYRIYITGRNATGATSSNFVVFLANDAGDVPYTGDGSSGLYVWGMQLESGVLTPGPYSPTVDQTSPVPGTLNGYRIHKYTGSGTSSFTPAVSGVVDVLVVAGGGGGGANHAGGGGGGGVIYREMMSVVADTPYRVTVGVGGTGSKFYNGQQGQPGSNGSNSVFGPLVAIGGGGGGGRNDTAEFCPGQAGGSGGGGGGAQASFPKNYVPGDGVEGQGFQGGRAIDIYGGGGGGAGGPGSPGLGSAGHGHGGPGRMYTISGEAVWYGGGGGGSSGGITYIGQGGIGGGGTGGTIAGNEGTPGIVNTGGGGGGGGAGGTTGQDGGSGIVIVRYRYD